ASNRESAAEVDPVFERRSAGYDADAIDRAPTVAVEVVVAVLRADVETGEDRRAPQLAVAGDADVLPAIAERKDVSGDVEVDDLALIGQRHRRGDLGDLRRVEPRISLSR